MSLPLQQKPNSKRTGKRISFFNDQSVTMKEASQNASEGPYYGLGAALASEAGHSATSGEASSADDEGQRMFLNSVIFSPEKGEQSHGHYQQMMPMKWALQNQNQNPSQQPQQRPTGGNWSQSITMTTWTQNLTTQNTFPKQILSEDVPAQQQQQQQQQTASARTGEKQQQPQQQQQHQQLVPSSSIDAYRDSTKGHVMDWEQPQQQQPQQQPQQQTQQPFHPSHKPAGLNPQQHSGTNPTGLSGVLQPFQVAFGQPKQHLPAGYYQVFQQQGGRTLPNLSYSMQTNSQHPMQSLQKQDQQHVQRQQQQQQQLILQQQQQQQMQHQYQQQQLIHQQPVQQQPHHQPQTQHTHQQSQQMQKQIQLTQHSEQMHELQAHLEHTSQAQQHQPQPQQQQQQPMQHILSHQTLQQQKLTTQTQQPQQSQQPQPVPQQKNEPQTQQHRRQHQSDFNPSHSHTLSQSHPDQPQAQPTSHSHVLPDKSAKDIQYPHDSQQSSPPRTLQPNEPLQPPHRSQVTGHRARRLSREDEGAPGGDNPFLLPAEKSQGPQGFQEPQKGASDRAARGVVLAGEGVKAAPTGVIQSTRRKRRVSQEANLETLAQKASEMESLPSDAMKDSHRPWSPSSDHCPRDRDMEAVAAKRHRDESLLPLVIPVSVPVRPVDPGSPPERDPAAFGHSWMGHTSSHQEHKPSVIVTRRRSLRSCLSDNSGQNGGPEDEKDADGKSAKSKRRPRPEPLFIPPPKLGTFIAPSVYSSISNYQSHLRSPVRLSDSALVIPPYTPPPILSPVREGSGLYFSTFLSTAAAAAVAAGSHVLPPVVTPKSATRSLLRSNSCDITPPVLSAMSEATPVSLEPRINIGVRYQAEIPELRGRAAAHYDQHKAEQAWVPLPELDAQPKLLERVNDLLHLACSSALMGGGTNQELAMHCLHTCKGDVMGALALLLLETPIFTKPHPLSDYHYSGSDNWTTVEKRLFNKGISAYKKDFLMVQKLVSSKTVAQCVEFYYTYKKQVKIGRNGTLIYGDVEPPETKPTEEEVDFKTSQKFEPLKQEEDGRKWDRSADRKRESSPGRVTQSSVTTEHSGKVLSQKTQDSSQRDQAVFAPQKPDPGPAHKSGTSGSAGKGTGGTAGQEGEFPCKKCGRVFFKVKSRSAHMKSHAEQEKKAAALRQKEAEERAAVALAAARQNGTGDGSRTGSKSSSDDSSDDDDEDEDWH